MPPAFTLAPALRVAPGGRKIFFTGRMFAGKDYCAAQAKREIFGFADPLYYLATYFLDVLSIPAIRMLLEYGSFFRPSGSGAAER